MLSVIQYSFNAVMPIILVILAGVLARRAGFLDSVTLRKVNKFNFRFNLCALMFVNIYEVDSIRHIPIRMGLFILLVLTVLFLLGLLLSGVFARERFRRGVLVQAQFRSNYAVIGLPVVTALLIMRHNTGCTTKVLWQICGRKKGRKCPLPLPAWI